MGMPQLKPWPEVEPKTPPTGGSGVTQDKPECEHDFVFLRQQRLYPHTDYTDTEDVFYCRHCLEYRRVKSS